MRLARSRQWEGTTGTIKWLSELGLFSLQDGRGNIESPEEDDDMRDKATHEGGRPMEAP